MSRLIKILKSAGEYFATASGGTIFLFSLIGAFTPIAPFIVLPIGCVVGLLFAYYGAKEAAKAYDLKIENERHLLSGAEKQMTVLESVTTMNQQLSLLKDDKSEAIKAVQDIEHKLSSIKEDLHMELNKVAAEDKNEAIRTVKIIDSKLTEMKFNLDEKFNRTDKEAQQRMEKMEYYLANLNEKLAPLVNDPEMPALNPVLAMAIRSQEQVHEKIKSLLSLTVFNDKRKAANDDRMDPLPPFVRSKTH